MSELKERFDSRHAREWPARLLAAMIAVFDLEFGPPPEEEDRPQLRVVK